jgi:hypothetical protein
MPHVISYNVLVVLHRNFDELSELLIALQYFIAATFSFTRLCGAEKYLDQVSILHSSNMLVTLRDVTGI